jgi:Predicted nucleic acid-binding protein, contains PIN domain
VRGEKVLIDTSIWIEYFGNPSEDLASRVDTYLSEETAFVPVVVLTELIQGAKSEKEISAIEELFLAVHLLDQQKDTWRHAGLLSYQLKRKGLTVGLTDCYIAQIALENCCEIFTKDAHFQLIAKVVPLPLVL